MTRRIAFISEHASPLNVQGGVDSGGQNIYVGQMARHLAKLDYEVDIFTRRDSPAVPPVYPWAKGVRVLHVPAGPPEYIRKENILPFMDEFAEYVLAACRSGGEYDLIHANFWMSGYVAAEMKQALGIPFVVTFHALGRVRRAYQQEADEFPDERFAIEERIVVEADRIVAECPQDEADLIRLYDADPAKLVMLPCGFDPEEFVPLPKSLARAAIRALQEDPLLLHVGRIVPRKGVDNLVRGLGRLVHKHGVPAQLLIAGAGLNESDPRLAAEVERLLEVARAEDVSDREQANCDDRIRI
jgi:D-inositol-3-phosphate glycosyltransferase